MGQRHKRRVIDQCNRHRAPFCLCAHSRQHVRLVVIRDRQHRIRALNIGFFQQAGIQTIPMQHNRPLQRIGRRLGNRAVLLDDLGAHTGFAAFERFGHGQTDIAAANQNHTFLHPVRLAENLHCAGDIFHVAKDVAFIACEKLIARLGRKKRAFAPHANNDGAQCGKQIGQLAQRRVDHRAIVIQLDPQKLRLPVEKRLCVKGRRGRQPLQCRIGHLLFGADHNINRHVIAAIEIGIDRIQIGLAAQTRDLARDGENRMGHLTGDHIHLVRMGRGDNHIGIARTGFVQNIGIACKSGDTLHIQRIGRLTHQRRIVVNDRDVVALAGQMTGNLPAHLSCTTNDDLHARPFTASNDPLHDTHRAGGQ